MSWKRLSIRMYAIFNTQFKFYFTITKTVKHKKTLILYLTVIILFVEFASIFKLKLVDKTQQ